MATVISPQILEEVQRPELPKRVPWYLWCAVLGVTSVNVGAYWDVSWHRSIGRDTFWTPAHMAIYLCGVLAGISFGYLILSTSADGPPGKARCACSASAPRWAPSSPPGAASP
jgi:hypothetical protein